MDETEMKLIAEQIRRALDLLNARLEAIECQQQHAEALVDLRLGTLENSQSDQEARLRALADTVTRLNTAAGLAQVAQAAFALVLSAIAAYLGRR